MYESLLAAPSAILFMPKYGREVCAGSTSVSEGPCRLIAGFPGRLRVGWTSGRPAWVAWAGVSEPVTRLRMHSAPSMLKSATPVDGDTEMPSSKGPPGLLLFTMLMVDMG